ncbi:hypothetical protein BU15DRAFT_84411 [Melanogaster broomeanus]|nr:hypothetical protein BU15DRAFT_84411 [Melanogaster broomeanus]
MSHTAAKKTNVQQKEPSLRDSDSGNPSMNFSYSAHRFPDRTQSPAPAFGMLQRRVPPPKEEASASAMYFCANPLSSSPSLYHISGLGGVRTYSKHICFLPSAG